MTFIPEIQTMLTIEDAKFIRQLRVELSIRWKDIAGICRVAWEDRACWDETKDQYAGMDLCEYAAEMLGEDYQEEPWD